MQRKRKQHTCMFDWQATQTQPCLFSTLSKGESHFRSLVCIMRNSKYASTSIMCTLRNSKCAFRIKTSKYALCRRVKTVLLYFKISNILTINYWSFVYKKHISFARSNVWFQKPTVQGIHVRERRECAAILYETIECTAWGSVRSLIL